jgi:hypothetical protein
MQILSFAPDKARSKMQILSFAPDKARSKMQILQNGVCTSSATSFS